MALSPKDTAALRATAARQVEDLIDDAIAADNSLDTSGEPVAPQTVYAWIPDGLLAAAKFDTLVRPVFLAAGWKTVDRGHNEEEGKDYVVLTS